jgi:predicted metalloprotease with PDZ domain
MPASIPATTKQALGPPQDESEYDAVFREGGLGLRLEERNMVVGSQVKFVSVVTSVTSGGVAEGEGVEEGDVVVGINGERFLSHAHAVATLKHGRRPVTVRFRRPDEYA